MKKLPTILCVLTLVFALLTGCNGTSTTPPEGSETSVTPTSITPPEGSETSVTPTPDSTESETPATAMWTPAPIPVDTIQVDPTQTGDLVIWLPPYSTWTATLMANYKAIYPNVNVIIEDYSKSEATEYNTQLSVELAADKGPDVLFPSHMHGSDIYKVVNAGAFLDLNELIEQDSDFNLDDYVRGVLDSGIYQGKRYVIPYTYFSPVYISSAAKLNEIGFDMSKTGDTSSFMNEVVRTMPKAQTNQHYQSMFNGSMDITDLLYNSGIKLVDFESNNVLPDEEGLKKLFDAFKPYYQIENMDSSFFDPLIPSYFLDGAIIFSGSAISNFFSLTSQKMEGGYEMTAMPGMDGKIYADTYSTVAIRSGSPNQQNAWNFIKLMLSPGFQDSNYLTMWFPVRKSSIIAQVEEQYNRFDGEVWGVIHTKISEAEKQAYIDLISNIDDCNTYDSPPTRKMFLEHMEPYLKDERSYEDCLAKLKNDLQLYVNE